MVSSQQPEHRHAPNNRRHRRAQNLASAVQRKAQADYHDPMLEPKGLAETSINGLPRRYAPRRDSNASLRTPLRLCERSEAIHLANNAVLTQQLWIQIKPINIEGFD